MELTILILLLPFFSFLLLGIGGKWMSHRTAGAIGTLVLGAVAVLSYVTAFQYFSAPRLEDGTFATLILRGYLLQRRYISIWAFCSILYP